MIFSGTCPHCGKETTVGQPYGQHDHGEQVEYQQDCDESGEPVVGVFRAEFVLLGVKAG